MMQKTINLYHKHIEPKRVVVIGSNGFIGSSCIKRLNVLGINNIAISRKEIDLMDCDAPNKLNKLIDNTDTVLFIAAEAPVKNFEMLKNNILICQNVCSAFENKNINHFIYISSDAVYSDSMELINEKYETKPENLHGIMHITRELIIHSMFKKKLCILRPTLIYGPNDPHNGYGPNSFMRKAMKSEDIKLFGKGEELRDHINIWNVVDAIVEVILRKILGTINLTTGKLHSFEEIAKIAISTANSKSKIIYLDRDGPMPHNGYRAFDNTLFNKTFSTKNVKLIDGLKEFIK